MQKLKTVALAAGLAAGLGLTPHWARAQNKLELNMATPWAGGHWLDIGAKNYAENVENMTDGRIKINVFPAGALGPALKVTETVQKGVADVGHSWPGYDWAVDRTGAIFSGWPARPQPGRDDDVALQWQRRRAVEAVAQEKFDVVALPLRRAGDRVLHALAQADPHAPRT